MEPLTTAEQFITKRNNDISQVYSFKLILFIAFCRCCSLTLLGLGLPNYLIFDLGESSLIAGMTLTAFCIPYSIFPFFINKLTDKFGRKKTTIFSILGMSISLIVYFFPINAAIAIVSRFFEGLFTSFFWPILQATISDVKDYDPNYDKRISRYNLSWNSGALFGYVLGAFAVYIIGSNEISFIISVLFCLVTIPASFLLKVPSMEIIKNFKNDAQKYHASIFEFHKISDEKNHISPRLKRNLINQKKNEGLEDEHILSKVVFIIPILLVLLHSGIMGSIFIIISTKFDTLGLPSYLTYIFSFVRMGVSLVMIFLLEKIRDHKIPIASFIIGLLYIIPPFIFAFSANIGIYIVLCGVLGITSISIYTFAARICLDKNAVNNTSKYSGYFEGVMGIGSGLGPLIVGIGADYNFNLTFYLMGFYGLFMTFCYSYLFRTKTKL